MRPCGCHPADPRPTAYAITTDGRTRPVCAETAARHVLAGRPGQIIAAEAVWPTTTETEEVPTR